eukprot:TRINITY_DN3291_c0_g1_i1.p1 TRINITY_DN3291_c0_g1~~TRINITY_DN3291_c0_g1_i1.p1  ORF type:complete len:762 (+),score=240.15 TRINITY_DN3291_c0_g1_i1:48-2288(+)
MAVIEHEVFNDKQMREAVHKFKTSDVTAEGYRNRGNTCYINAVLQCLLKGTPLGSAVLCVKEHECKTVCYVCLLRKLQVHGENVLGDICRNISHVSKMLTQYSQEDAHEFYRHLLDTLNLSYLNRYREEKGLREVKEVELTTLPNRLFGGFYTSKVTCENAHTSVVKQPFLDVSLRLTRDADTLQDLMAATTRPDRIGDYECEKCKAKVSAHKAIHLHTLPPVLAIHLQRFEHTIYGVKKIPKYVSYPLQLDVSDMLNCSDNDMPPITKYALAALVLHQGGTAHSGHYTCMVNQRGNWIFYNDALARPITQEVALKQSPYLLFYLRNDIVPQPAPCTRVEVDRTPRRRQLHDDMRGSAEVIGESTRMCNNILEKQQEKDRKRKIKEVSASGVVLEERGKRVREVVPCVSALSQHEEYERARCIREVMTTSVPLSHARVLQSEKEGRRQIESDRGDWVKKAVEAERRGRAELNRKSMVGELVERKLVNSSRPLVRNLHGHLGNGNGNGKATTKQNRAEPLTFNRKKGPPVDAAAPPVAMGAAPEVTRYYAFPYEFGLLVRDDVADVHRRLTDKVASEVRGKAELRLYNVRLEPTKQSIGHAKVTSAEDRATIEVEDEGTVYRLNKFKDGHSSAAFDMSEELFKGDLRQSVVPVERCGGQTGMLPKIVDAVAKVIPSHLSSIMANVSRDVQYIVDKKHPKAVVEMGQTFLNGVRECAQFEKLVDELKKIVFKIGTKVDTSIFDDSQEL